ncbi:MAG: hypothetical protein P0119_10385 [Nitrospira sp.]|nr:hypothetical protein [Nitrospira sp.]
MDVGCDSSDLTIEHADEFGAGMGGSSTCFTSTKAFLIPVIGWLISCANRRLSDPSPQMFNLRSLRFQSDDLIGSLGNLILQLFRMARPLSLQELTLANIAAPTSRTSFPR